MAIRIGRLKIEGQSLRDWLNVLVAIGAFFLSIISFWTTARISGLEDYLRSEIGRRNSELDALTGRSERAQAVAEKRAEALSSLQFSTDQLEAAFSMAQVRLEQERAALGELQGQVNISRAQLAELNQKSAAQSDALDLLNRRRVFEIISMNGLLLLDVAAREERITGLEQALGQTAYELVLNVHPSEADRDLTPYFEKFRTSAVMMCRNLKSFAPRLPQQRPYPKIPLPPGKPVKGDPMARIMTDRERSDWEQAREDSSQTFNDVTEYNLKAVKYRFALVGYAADSARYCSCRALADQLHPASAVCPGTNPPVLPEVPAGM